MKIEKKIGRYEIVSVVGRGAMGTVYKAIDPLIERTVAVKTISLALSTVERAEFEERFFREAKSAGRLNHPNIVTIYDVGETDDEAYIAMEFLEGQSLRELLDSGVVLEVSQICRIAKRIAGALDYAHSNQVVHRDIKPGNVMIGRNREIKIMDFGIAKIASDSRTLDGTLLGSPKYMAPEQILGQPVDGRADIFALGALLYEMLTGRAPFGGDNLNAIMYKIVHEDPPPPSRAASRVPTAFDVIVAKALAKHPDERYQSARQFGSDLQRYERSAPPETRRALASPRTAAPVAPAHETTVLLAPRARSRAASLHARFAGIDMRSAAARLRRLHGRANYLLFAIPVLATIAFAIFLQMNPPYERGGARPLAVPEERVARSSSPASPSSPPVLAAAASDATASAPPAAAASPAAAAASAEGSAGSPDAAAASPASLPATLPIVASSPSAPVASPRTTVDVPPAPLAAARAKAAHATVHLAIAPWGQVFIDGRNAGVTPPLKRLRLAPGNHKLEIRNSDFPPFRKSVEVAEGASFNVRHTFK